MTEELIDKLKEEIYSSHLSDFQIKLDEVLSICDSEIEKLMLLQLFFYFQNYQKTIRDDTSYFTEIDFIEEEIVTYDPDEQITDEEIRRLKEKVIKRKYRSDGIGYYKYIGFKFKRNLTEGISVSWNNKDSSIEDIIIREFEIYPQYEVKLEGIQYKIDIAIILKRKRFGDGKIIDTRKIAIECDGYEYHSSQQQIKNDDIRARKLKINGWKEVFRYSGTEIYHIRNINKVHSIFEEIITMLMI